MTAETQFYQRHYGNGVQIGATVLDVFARDMFAPGKRYSLLIDDLSSKDQPVGGCIVEIGCGGGEALLILSCRHRFDRVVGIDIALALDHHKIEEVSQRRIEFLNSNLNERWPFGNAEVDYLVAMMVIEHLFDPFFAFREIKRVLSRDGKAYVNLPLVTGLRNRIRLVCGNLPETSVPYDHWFKKNEWDGNHLHYFSMRSIHDLARACDLCLTKVSGVGRYHRIKSWAPELLASEVTFRLEHVTAQRS
jgi:SAM-dependent methyltransferase